MFSIARKLLRAMPKSEPISLLSISAELRRERKAMMKAMKEVFRERKLLEQAREGENLNVINNQISVV